VLEHVADENISDVEFMWSNEEDGTFMMDRCTFIMDRCTFMIDRCTCIMDRCTFMDFQNRNNHLQPK